MYVVRILGVIALIAVDIYVVVASAAFADDIHTANPELFMYAVVAFAVPVVGMMLANAALGAVIFYRIEIMKVSEDDY